MSGFGFLATPSMQDIERIDKAITEIRTILLTMMEPDAAERFRRTWFPKAGDE